MKTLKLAALTLLVGVPLAAASSGPISPAAPGPVGSGENAVLPDAVRTFADAYNGGTGHWLLGTADPNGASCLPASSCPAGSTQIARAGYVGSFEIAGVADPFVNLNGNQMTAVFVFDASKIDAARSYALRLSNIQNFTGRPFFLGADVFVDPGDGTADPGGRGVFDMNGPFGIPTARSIDTVLTIGRSVKASSLTQQGFRQFSVGGVVIRGNGPLVAHPADPSPPYLTFDRSAVIQLGDISDLVEAAQALVVDTDADGVPDDHISYTSCRHSCTPPLTRNVDCDQTIHNPLYVTVTATAAGEGSAMRRLQENLLVSNIVHIHGDCDFAGESFPTEFTKVELIWD